MINAFRKGYPFDDSYDGFSPRMRSSPPIASVMQDNDKNEHVLLVDELQAVFAKQHGGKGSGKDWSEVQFGKSRIFYRAGVKASLYKKAFEDVASSVILMQRVIRGSLARSKMKKIVSCKNDILRALTNVDGAALISSVRLADELGFPQQIAHAAQLGRARQVASWVSSQLPHLRASKDFRFGR